MLTSDKMFPNFKALTEELQVIQVSLQKKIKRDLSSYQSQFGLSNVEVSAFLGLLQHSSLQKSFKVAVQKML